MYLYLNKLLNNREYYFIESAKRKNSKKNKFRDGEAVISTLSIGVGGLYIEYPLSTYH
jgi:hypothetical protein